MSDKQTPVLAISCGDLNGVGMEIIIKTLENHAILDLCTPVVFASSKVAGYHRKAIDRPEFKFHIINSLDKIQPGKANLYNVWKEEVNLEMGKVDPEVGAFAIKSLEAACDSIDEGHCDALITAPIHKKAIQSENFRFTGHTDYLEDRYQSKAMMLMVSEEMRIALATVHQPLSTVTKSISTALLNDKFQALHHILKEDFHLPKGRIAVLSLDPHAGDGGVIGKADDEIVKPSIEKAFQNGIAVFGPFPADSFFGSGQYRQFDAILAMYHDQGLTPFKSLSFGHGVNCTAGLPIVRCSPDHGTAFDIAGQGQADPSSFREAMYLAIDLVKNRGVSKEINANPLKISKKKS